MRKLERESFLQIFQISSETVTFEPFLSRTFQPPTLLEDVVVARIAEKHGKSPAQVCIRFLVQQGIATIPKSTNATRLRENLDVGYPSSYQVGPN